VEDRSFLSDELIASLVTDEGTKQKAVIAGIEYIIMMLSTPDFKADWLSVSNGEAIKSYERMLATKKKKFGVGGITAGVVYTYRSDSFMEDPNT
jgi:hypothetical protein